MYIPIRRGVIVSMDNWRGKIQPDDDKGTLLRCDYSNRGEVLENQGSPGELELTEVSMIDAAEPRVGDRVIFKTYCVFKPSNLISHWAPAVSMRNAVAQLENRPRKDMPLCRVVRVAYPDGWLEVVETLAQGFGIIQCARHGEEWLKQEDTIMQMCIASGDLFPHWKEVHESHYVLDQHEVVKV